MKEVIVIGNIPQNTDYLERFECAHCNTVFNSNEYFMERYLSRTFIFSECPLCKMFATKGQ
jgi:hypothetical protein